MLGPNGFHRHLAGDARRAVAAAQPAPDVTVGYDTLTNELVLHLVNAGSAPAVFTVVANAYFAATPASYRVTARSEQALRVSLQASQRWYDFSVQVAGHAGFLRRFAGRMENGQDGVSDPAMGGVALADAPSVG